MRLDREAAVVAFGEQVAWTWYITAATAVNMGLAYAVNMILPRPVEELGG